MSRFHERCLAVAADLVDEANTLRFEILDALYFVRVGFDHNCVGSAFNDFYLNYVFVLHLVAAEPIRLMMG